MATVKQLKPINTNVYIEFDMIVDIDVGIIKFIGEYFNDDRIFYSDIFDNDDNIIKGLLYDRQHYNPLTVPAINEDDSVLDDLYDQFIEKYKEEILTEYACVTTIVEFAAKLIFVDSYTAVTFICKDKLEHDIMKNIMDQLKCNPKDYTILVTNNEEISVAEADALLIKYSKNLFNYNKLEGKTIYLADLFCNIDNKVYEDKHTKIPNVDAVIYAENNEFKLITMYPYDDSYSVNNEFDYGYSNSETTSDEDDRYIFEGEVPPGDIELLEQWLSPEEMAAAKVGNIKNQDDDDEINLEAFNPFINK